MNSENSKQTPWRGEFRDILDAKGNYVARVSNGAGRSARDEIIRAVNSHGDLLRCAEILAALESDDGGRSFPSKQDCQFARMVISRAEGKAS